MDDLNNQEKWILEWIRKHGDASVVDSAFHDACSEKFGWKQKPKNFGACPCPRAMHYLHQIYTKGFLNRTVIGLSGRGEGFPNWTYVYHS